MAIHILHLEDSPLDAELVAARIHRSLPSCEITWVDSRVSFEDAMRRRRFDAIVSDFALPDFNGHAALKLACELAPGTPFIFLSGTLGEEIAIETLQQGATDYVLKQRMDRLGPAIERAVFEAHEKRQRHATQLALSQSEQRLRLAVNAAPMLLFTMDASMRCTWVGKGHRLIPAEKLLGKRLDEVFLACRVQEFIDLIANVLGTGRAQRQNVRLNLESTTSSEHFDVSAELATYQGSMVITVAALDTTEQVLAEEALREAQTRRREELVALVHERTAALERSHEQLRQSERMASLGTLSAGIGHDMGNLLLPVRLRLESLKEHVTSDAASEDIKAIASCTEYLQRLAGGLRLFTLDPQDVRASDLVTELASWWDQVRPFFQNALPKEVRLDAEFFKGVTHLRVPRHQLTQAVFNLVQNSGEALRERGTGRVTISIEPAGAGLARLIVGDDGPGMPEEVRQRCLDPFYTTKTRRLSTGLGLSIVQGVVKTAGGTLNVESAPGRGTRFIMVLPIGTDEDDHSERPLAVVDVQDQRQSAFIVSVLNGLGLTARAGASVLTPAEAKLLVTDGALELLRSFLDEQSGRAGVLLSDVQATDHDHHARLVVIRSRDRATAIRTKLEHAAGLLSRSEALQSG